ncbi:unnamed protein product [Parajaminaea phylloscopi]
MRAWFLSLVLATYAEVTRGVILSWDCSKIPNICSNDLFAIRCAGKSSTLHRDPTSATAHRAANACHSPNRCAGDTANGSCDEYPYASSAEGGAGAITRCVPAHENSVQGGTLSSFYTRSKISNGDGYDVAFHNIDGLEYAAGSCSNQGDEVQRKRQAGTGGSTGFTQFDLPWQSFATASGYDILLRGPFDTPEKLASVIGTPVFLSFAEEWTSITALA